MSVQPLSRRAKERVETVLARATEDIKFREKLLNNPEKALADSGLAKKEREAVGSLRRVALEEWGIDIRRFRSFLRDNGNGIRRFGQDVKERIESVLTRAARDIKFREKLLANPEKVLAQTDLTPEEREAVGSLRRVALEEWGVDVRRFRSFLRDNGNGIHVAASRAQKRLESVLTRAADDIAFRERLLADPQATLADTDLTDNEKQVIGSLRRVALEEWGVDVRRFRSFLRDNGNSAPVIG